MHPDAEDTATIYANTQRVAGVAWKIAAGILAVLVTWALTGCAVPVVKCPTVEAIAMPGQDGKTYLIMDEPNIATFWQRAQMLARDECTP